MLILLLICVAQTSKSFQEFNHTRYFQITELSHRPFTAATYGRSAVTTRGTPGRQPPKSFKVDPCRWLGNGKIASKWSRPIVAPLAATHSKCGAVERPNRPTFGGGEREAVHMNTCCAFIPSLPRSVCLPSSGQAKTINKTLRHLLLAS